MSGVSGQSISVTERAIAQRMAETGHSIFVIASYLGTTLERVRQMLQ